MKLSKKILLGAFALTGLCMTVGVVGSNFTVKEESPVKVKATETNYVFTAAGAGPATAGSYSINEGVVTVSSYANFVLEVADASGATPDKVYTMPVIIMGDNETVREGYKCSLKIWRKGSENKFVVETNYASNYLAKSGEGSKSFIVFIDKGTNVCDSGVTAEETAITINWYDNAKVAYALQSVTLSKNAVIPTENQIPVVPSIQSIENDGAHTFFRFNLEGSGISEKAGGKYHLFLEKNGTYSPNYTWADYSFLKVIKISKDGYNWFPLLADVNSSSSGSFFFNQGADLRIPFKSNGTSYYDRIINFVKIPAGTTFPEYDYTLDTTGTKEQKCYVTTSDVVYKRSKPGYLSAFVLDELGGSMPEVSINNTLSDFAPEFRFQDTEYSSGSVDFTYPNNVVDVTFNYKVGEQGKQSCLLFQNIGGNTGAPLVFWYDKGQLVFTESNTLPAYKQFYTDKDEIAVNPGDYVKMRYVRQYNSDFTAHVAWIFINDNCISKFAYTGYDTSAVTPGAPNKFTISPYHITTLKSWYEEGYSTKEYNVTINYSDKASEVVKVTGGNTLSIDSEHYVIKNEMGLELFYNPTIKRDTVLTATAITRETRTFSNVNSDNNNVDDGSDKTLSFSIFSYNAAFPGSVNSYNQVKSGFKINGVSLDKFEKAKVTYAHGSKHIAIWTPKTAFTTSDSYPYTLFEIEDKTIFQGALLGEAKAYINPTTNKWVAYTNEYTVSLTDANSVTTVIHMPSGLTLPSKWVLDETGHCSNKWYLADNETVFDPTKPITGNVVAHQVIKEHTYTHHDAVAPKCEATGLIEHYTCNDCSKYFVKVDEAYVEKTLADITVKATGHEHNPVAIQEATRDPAVAGVAAHYICNHTDCGCLFSKVDGEYVKTTLAELQQDYLDDIASSKTTAISGLTSYKNPADYTVNKTAYDAAIANGKTAINACINHSEITSALDDAKAAIDLIKNDATMLAEAKVDACGKLDEYVDPAKYTVKINELNYEISLGKKNINDATSIPGVATALENAKKAIDDIPTDAQLLAQAKQNAIDVLVAAYPASDYTINKTAYDDALVDAKDTINSATTLDEIPTKTAAAAAIMDAVKDDATVLVEAKQAAIADLTTYVDPADYTIKAKDLADAIKQGCIDINAAKSVSEVGTALAAAKLVIDDIPTDAALLAAAKVAAIKDLNDYVDPDNYTINYQQLDAALTAGTQSIANATTFEEVETRLDASKAVIDLIDSDQVVYDKAEAAKVDVKIEAIGTVTLDSKADIEAAEEAYGKLTQQQQKYVSKYDTLVAARATYDALVAAKELADAKTAAIKGLEEYKNPQDYTINKTAYDAAIAEGKNAINSATKVADVTTALNKAKAALDAIKTDSAVMSEARTAAKTEVDNFYKGIDLSKYNDENKKLIETKTTEVKAAIDTAKTTAEIDSAVAAYKTAVNAIPQNKGGCSGDVTATALVALVGLLGAGLALVLNKKRKLAK